MPPSFLDTKDVDIQAKPNITNETSISTSNTMQQTKNIRHVIMPPIVLNIILVLFMSYYYLPAATRVTELSARAVSSALAT